MKIIYFLETYIAGGSDKIANTLLNNLKFEQTILFINGRADDKIILDQKIKNNIKIEYYNLITPAEIHEKVNNFKNISLVYVIFKFFSKIFSLLMLGYSIFYFYKKFKNYNASFFFSHNGGHPGGLYNGTALMAASLSNIKFKFYAYHSNPAPLRKHLFFFDFFWDRIIEKSSKLITISNASAKKTLKQRFIKSFPIVIYNGVKKNKIKNYSNSKILEILHVGYFDLNKNQILLLKSLLKIVEKNICNIHITFVGKVVDVNIKNVFDNFLNQHNLNKYVTVEGFKKAVIPYYYKSDVLICTSFVEGLSLSILEAMSIGLPIISTDTGGVNEQIVSEENGYIIENNNPLHLSNKIEYLIKNRKVIEIMGRKSHKIFKNKFDINKMISNYNNLFKI